MIAPVPDRRLVDLIARSQRLLVFTGAGISTGSGIPDFRGPQGVWRRRQPVYFDEFLASEEKRVEYWDQKLEGWESFRDAAPNACHRSIARLAETGRVIAIVTQNIDGLHQRAGGDPDRIIELHGTNAATVCVSCARRGDPAPAMEWFRLRRTTPRCDCGGLLKTATISFGQALDPSVLGRAADAAEGADAVLALGSTLSVHPAAGIPLVAARRGAPYGIINRGDTEHDTIATFKIDGDVAAIIPEAVDAALAGQRN
jgi:NAD-dependent deacetylase